MTSDYEFGASLEQLVLSFRALTVIVFTEIVPSSVTPPSPQVR